MRKLKLQFANLVNKSWFIMLVFFPLVLISKLGLFLHPVFTLIFILLGVFQILFSLSVLTNKKEENTTGNVRTFKKKLLIIITALVFISVNLLAVWVSYKTAQRELISFENLHLLSQFFYLLSNLILIISLFVALFLYKLPKKDE